MVNIVHDQVDLLPLAKIDDIGDKLIGEDRAGRIVGAVDNDRPGVGADSLLDILHARVKGAILGRDNHRDTIAHLDHLRIADPIWGQDDDFILRIKNAVQNIEQRLLGAG